MTRKKRPPSSSTLPISAHKRVGCLSADLRFEVRRQKSEKRFQEPTYFIVVADCVKVEQCWGFQREHQSQSPPDPAFVNVEPAPLGREVANASAGMQMWVTEILLNPPD